MIYAGAQPRKGARNPDWDQEAALFQSAVRAKQDRRNVNMAPAGADTGCLTLPPLLQSCRRINCLHLHLAGAGGTARAIRYPDFGICTAIHARLHRAGLRNKPRHQGQHGEKNTLHYVQI